MDNLTGNLSFEPDSILKNYGVDENFQFHSIQNHSIDSDDLEEFLDTFAGDPEFLDSEEMLFAGTDNLSNDQQTDAFLVPNPVGDSMDHYLNKQDSASYANGSSSGINSLNGNQQMVSSVPLQSQDLLVNNMNQSIQPTEVATR